MSSTEVLEVYSLLAKLNIVNDKLIRLEERVTALEIYRDALEEYVNKLQASVTPSNPFFEQKENTKNERPI